MESSASIILYKTVMNEWKSCSWSTQPHIHVSADKTGYRAWNTPSPSRRSHESLPRPSSPRPSPSMRPPSPPDSAPRSTLRLQRCRSADFGSAARTHGDALRTRYETIASVKDAKRTNMWDVLQHFSQLLLLALLFSHDGSDAFDLSMTFLYFLQQFLRLFLWLTIRTHSHPQKLLFWFQIFDKLDDFTLLVLINELVFGRLWCH